MNALISGVRTAEIGAADPIHVAKFYEEVWGLERIADRPGSSGHKQICFRGTAADHPILTIVSGGTSARRIVFNARGEDALTEMHGRIKAAGLPVSSSPHTFDDGFGAGFDSRDPEGRMISFVAHDGSAKTGRPDRFMRVTHFNLNCGAYDSMRAYMCDVLGCLVVDETRTNGFFNCGVDHHCLVIGRTSMQPTLNHIAFEMPDLDSMMRMCGTMREHGYPIEWGVGRHGPGDNVFAYFAGPEEMPIECTAEILQIDGTYSYRGPDNWGFPPGRTDQWGVTGPPSTRIKRIQTQFPFIELPLR
jgi:catechol 2,3-dioxygenase-like lactoylglutathione lyase family enzyme/predicted enzyme related to lactoylglutathione lyase